MISFNSVCKTFQMGPLEQQVLRHISFDVAHHEFVAIVGRSGSGKSTTMNILGLLDAPTSGRYLLDNREVGQLSAQEKATLRNQLIGFVFQQFLLLPRMRVIDNVALPLLYRGLDQNEAKFRALEMLDLVDMASFAESYSTTLSGGQQQRVAIARALIGEPQLILADEPTGALDTENGQMVMDVIKKFNKERGVTVVMITHDLELAAMADRCLRLVDGQLVEG